jgi:cytochrome b6-f complex iron-sulfur subunit
MNRKEFISKVGFGVAAVMIPACITGLSGCKKTDNGPTNVDFTIDISTGPLSANGGFVVKNQVIVARTNSGTFLAVAAACTHEGTNVNYNSSGNKFVCPNHGAQFSSNGAVTQGPANTNLKQYNTSLSGTMLRVFS